MTTIALLTEPRLASVQPIILEPNRIATPKFESTRTATPNESLKPRGFVDLCLFLVPFGTFCADITKPPIKTELKARD